VSTDEPASVLAPPASGELSAVREQARAGSWTAALRLAAAALADDDEHLAVYLAARAVEAAGVDRAALGAAAGVLAGRGMWAEVIELAGPRWRAGTHGHAAGLHLLSAHLRMQHVEEPHLVAGIERAFHLGAGAEARDDPLRPDRPDPRVREIVDRFAGIGLMWLALEKQGWTGAYGNDIDPKKLAMYEGQFGAGFDLRDIHDVAPAERRFMHPRDARRTGGCTTGARANRLYQCTRQLDAVE